MFACVSANWTARRLLAIDVPIVMMRVTPASSGALQDLIEVSGEVGIIEMGVRFDQHRGK